VVGGRGRKNVRTVHTMVGRAGDVRMMVRVRISQTDGYATLLHIAYRTHTHITQTASCYLIIQDSYRKQVPGSQSPVNIVRPGSKRIGKNTTYSDQYTII